MLLSSSLSSPAQTSLSTPIPTRLDHSSFKVAVTDFALVSEEFGMVSTGEEETTFKQSTIKPERFLEP